MANIVKTVTPHAAVIVWNFVDRLGSTPTSAKDKDVIKVDKKIISTLSLVNISTSKSKGSPTGRFEITLAPTKNWVAALTAGSWCCILMSQKPITKDDFDKVDPEKLKMIGKIESVRQQVSVDPETGARRTTYSVTGVDWGHIFENNVYIDPYIDPKNNTIGATTYLELFQKIVNKDGNATFGNVSSNLSAILQIMGAPLNENFAKAGDEVNQVASADFKFLIPTELASYLGLAKKSKIKSNSIADYIKLYAGKLVKEDDLSDSAYKDIKESFGMVDPTCFIGTNSMWQILIDNSSPVINEMFCDLSFNDKNEVVFGLWNRIKPFSYRSPGSTKQKIRDALKKESVSVEVKKGQDAQKAQNAEKDRLSAEAERIISPFQNIRTIDIDLEDVRSIDCGTNWRDKFNFVEIKPSITALQQMSAYIKTTSQLADVGAFKREGMRPLIFGTKQLPSKKFVSEKSKGGSSDDIVFDVNGLQYWKYLLKEWYFDTHKLLNGTVNITGQNTHIRVGDNIMIDGKILGLTPNINSGVLKKPEEYYLLAHVESINHSFSVSSDGARSFTTTISFVRGIIVNETKSIVNEGSLDSLANRLNVSDTLNSANVISTSSELDPDVKVRGR